MLNPTNSQWRVCSVRLHLSQTCRMQRRCFACANDSAGVRMRNRFLNRTHRACAARFRTVVGTLVSRVVSKMCAMTNMGLILRCTSSCHAIRRRAHELSARTECTCSRRNCVHAGARMSSVATWCIGTGVCGTVSTCTCAFKLQM